MCGQLAFRESAFCALVLLLAAGQPARGQTIGGDYGPADIAYGARLYTMHCAQCHGPTGDQVGTVDLGSGKFRTPRPTHSSRRCLRTAENSRPRRWPTWWHIFLRSKVADLAHAGQMPRGKDLRSSRHSACGAVSTDI